MNSSVVANTPFSALEPYNSIGSVSNADDITRACQPLEGVELSNTQSVALSESTSISHAESDSHMPSMSTAIPSSASHISENSNDNAQNPSITGIDSDRIAKLRRYFDDKFHIMDLGKLKYFLGIEVACSPKGIALSQRKYALDILAESGLTSCKPVSSPMEQQHKLSLETGDFCANPEQYRQIVG
ncbi:hypothetical protein GH714_010212 [Hevea brasiliensis]|uniref:Reverse transcriptase Ty1/copia-type domain-containing protein n=1 Tax=Hevea brasiliensis TaxID=3981 RepID=A0A6A6KB62_HEVBR|nr:hypothetical protein GH714_010212 [Hevea brasiliensis]